ncbi:hypothetical protein, partial [Mesomycoplasma hyorhinis]
MIIQTTITRFQEEEDLEFEQRQRDTDIQYQYKIKQKNRQRQQRLLELENIYNTIIDTFEDQDISVFSNFNTQNFLNEVNTFIVNNNQKKKEIEEKNQKTKNDFKIELNKLLSIQNQLKSKISSINN